MQNQLTELTERLEKIELLLAQVLMRKDGKKDDDKLLSIKEAAAYLHLSVSRMYSLIYEGKLKPIQRMKNSKILFSTQELDNYLAEDYKRLPELLINNSSKNTVNNKKRNYSAPYIATSRSAFKTFCPALIVVSMTDLRMTKQSAP